MQLSFPSKPPAYARLIQRARQWLPALPVLLGLALVFHPAPEQRADEIRVKSYSHTSSNFVYSYNRELDQRACIWVHSFTEETIEKKEIAFSDVNLSLAAGGSDKTMSATLWWRPWTESLLGAPDADTLKWHWDADYPASGPGTGQYWYE